jgi:LysM repeat protein
MKKLLIWVLVLSFSNLFAQSIIKHKVAKGETITQIAKKYSVTPLDIYKLNPDAQAGAPENTILIIPKKGIVDLKTSATSKKHTVLPKETFYSISKLYEVSVLEIQNANPEAKNGLSIGQVLIIPSSKAVITKPEPKKTTSNEALFHVVLAKETKFGIAKQYGISVEELEKKNPDISTGLPIGYTLLIKGERPKEVLKPIEPIKEPKVVPNSVAIKTIDYTVKQGETLYGLANMFNCSQEQLLATNPELKEGVREGMLLKIPSKATPHSLPVKESVDLTKTVSKQNKKLALLLPFNINKLDQDTINSTKSRLQKDKFLNMTLDFYSGALMAIDSIRKLGATIDVTILDSDETKSNSNVVSLIDQNNLKGYDAIIGPFYQNNVERTAQLLENVPVISPLSKDYDKVYPNLIQATPSNNDVKNAMFDFMRSKSGNILAIVDPKKQSSKQFISENYTDVQFVNFTEKGALDTVQLKSLLVKDKINFVILETEKTNLILSATSALQTLLKEFQIQLVILEQNEAFDYEEIPLSRLTKLKLTFPSQTRENYSTEASSFESNYRKLNKIYPNSFATRGFDVTFDVLIRLSQEKAFQDSIVQDVSQQVENKFYYIANPSGGYTNKGVYILYYDSDLTIKEAN